MSARIGVFRYLQVWQRTRRTSLSCCFIRSTGAGEDEGARERRTPSALSDLCSSGTRQRKRTMAQAGMMSRALTEIHTGSLAESRRSRSASTLTTSTGTTGSKSRKRGCRPYGNTPGNTPTEEQPTTGRLARPITIQWVLYEQLNIKSTFAWWRLAARSQNIAVTTTTPFERQTDKCILYG